MGSQRRAKISIQMGAGGGWRAIGGLKQTFKQKWQCCVISIGHLDWHNSQGRPSLPLESVWHPCSLINATKGPHRRLNAPLWFDSIGKRPPVIADMHGHLFYNAWCLWIGHECTFRVQPKNGFQYF